MPRCNIRPLGGPAQAARPPFGGCCAREYEGGTATAGFATRFRAQRRRAAGDPCESGGTTTGQLERTRRLGPVAPWADAPSDLAGTPRRLRLAQVGPCSTDGELASAILRRDTGAYEELYRRHAGSVRAAARLILGNRPECDDVVADVFVGLWTSPGLFDPTRGSLLGFLRLRAKGRSIDLLRSESSRRRRELHVHAAASPAPAADSSVLADESTAQLWLALGSLAAPEQEAIRLAYFGRMSYREVAVLLREPEGTVKSRIRQGLLHLRLRLEQARAS
jgi:RNA polymerase sigma-70 factor (ECF subfamily)